MKNIYLFFVAFIPIVIASKGSKHDSDSEEVVWEIPFEKAKVNYHRSRVCITIKGTTNCLSKNLQPGDPQAVADMFKILEKHGKLPSNSKRPKASNVPTALNTPLDEDPEVAEDAGADSPSEIVGGDANGEHSGENAEDKPAEDEPEPQEPQDRVTDTETGDEQSVKEEPAEPGPSAEQPTLEPQPDDAADTAAKRILRAIEYLDENKKWGMPYPDERRNYRRAFRIY